MKICILILLVLGFGLLFFEGRVAIYARAFYERTLLEIDAVARQRDIANRKNRILGAQKSLWAMLEQNLYYSGIKLKFPNVTAELWAAMHLAVCAGVLAAGGVFFRLMDTVFILLLFCFAERWILQRLQMKNMRVVNEELPKLLDFLGNYSITSGEITGVFLQVARYVKNPLAKVLESCYYEAQTTGDTRAALLSMRDKIEHPQFKELVNNMEVNLRYCSDFSALVAGSKRTMREYLKNARERSGMLREALVSMALLLGMSAIIMWVVGGMVNMSLATMIFGTLPGKIGLVGVTLIALLFYRQVNGVHG